MGLDVTVYTHVWPVCGPRQSERAMTCLQPKEEGKLNDMEEEEEACVMFDQPQPKTYKDFDSAVCYMARKVKLSYGCTYAGAAIFRKALLRLAPVEEAWSVLCDHELLCDSVLGPRNCSQLLEGLLRHQEKLQGIPTAFFDGHRDFVLQFYDTLIKMTRLVIDQNGALVFH